MNISEVKGIINDNITSNGAGQITGEVLNSTLMSIVDTIESNAGSSSVTPDWTAKEGESGYIENKPFGFNITETYNYKRDEDEYVDDRIDIEMFSFSPNYDEEKGYYIYPDIEMIGSTDSIGGADGTGIIYYLGSLSNLPTYTGYYDYTDGEQWISAESQVDSDYEGLWLEDSDGGQSYYYLHLRLWVSRINYDINVNVGHMIQMSEKYIPDTIARKSDLENIDSGSSNEYVITQFTYSSVIESLNDGEYLEYLNNDLLDACRQNKTIYLKDTHGNGKIICDYTYTNDPEYDPEYEMFHITCKDILFAIDHSSTVYDFSKKPENDSNIIIPNFTAEDVLNSYLDNNTVYYDIDFFHAFGDNPTQIIIKESNSENKGYIRVLSVEGEWNDFSICYIYKNFYYRVHCFSDHISDISRAPMPAFEQNV